MAGSAFPKGPGFGPELGVGGSLRRMEGMGTTKLFGSQIRPTASPKIKMQTSGSGFGPTPGKPAFSAGVHQVNPHIRNW